MTAENRKKYDAKLKRVNDAIALREPDMVPIKPPADLFPVYNAGYTVAEVVYDTTLGKMREAIIKYLNDFDPDAAPYGLYLCGRGAGNGDVAEQHARGGHARQYHRR